MNIDPQYFYSPEVRVVEASAGSGKTYALARRYVRLILHLAHQQGGVPVHSILAITFTNKAAFEMKERILRFLKELALGIMAPAEQEEMLAGMEMSPAEARALSGNILDAILRNYNYFQVQTIDKFINTLLVSSAFQIGLTANFRIRTDARPYLALALDSLIDQAASDASVRKAFDDFLTSMLLVESRLAWIPRDIVLSTMEQLFSEYNTHGRDLVKGDVGPQDMLKAKLRAIEDVRAFFGDMPRGLNKTFEKSLHKFVENNERGFSFSDKLSNYFQKGKDIPLTKESTATAAQHKCWDNLQHSFIRAAQMEVGHLYDPYIAIFEQVRRIFDDACVREDVLFLAQLNVRARMVYEQGVAPEELYYRLSTRFEHYLFDEFQDTSLLQWANLSVLPDDAIARGGSLFYVGDKKQAIYSFRGGDTRLFDEIHAAYSDPGYHPSREVLDVSRRSHRAIVEFNNEVFSLENLSAFMRTRDGKEGLLVPARPSDFDELERVYKTAEQKVLDLEPEGCVRVEMLEGARKEASREDARPRVMARLKELVSRFRLREIAVLVRKNDDVEAVTRWLIEEGIPSSSERTLNIKEDPLVAEVVAFLKFLVSPVDDAAFGAFLQGDIMAFASGIPSGTWRDLIVAWRQDKKDRLYKFFSAAYPKVWENLVEEFFRNAGLYPAYETLASFYRRTGVLEHFTDERGFLVHFLGLVKANEEEFPDLADFLEYYEELEGEDLYVDVAGGDAVQVMTVHKAKGLEFRAVILPFLTVTAAPGRPAQKRALEYVLKPEEDGLKLYHINKTLAQYSDKAEELDVDRRMQAFFAELNSAYVALTRAACEMYIYIPPRAGNSRNLACYLIPERLYARGTPAAAYPSKKNDDAGTPVELAPPACRDWIAFLQDEFKEDPLALMKERREGVMAHALLERIVPSYAPTAAQGLELAVASLFPGGEAVDVAIRLSAFLEAPVVKPFFEGISGKVLTEVELANRFGDVRRIDRLIVEPGRVTVIDFKMGRASSENGEAQVREYMELVQDIYPGRKVRGVLLFIREKEAQELS